MDIYFPVAEPLLGQTPLVNPEDYCGGGGTAKYMKRVSMLSNRTSFTSGSYAQRYDLNNGQSAMSVTVTNLGIQSIYSFYQYSKYFITSVGGWTPTTDYNNVYIDNIIK